MANPTSGTNVPHIIGVTLDSTGVANTQVVVINRTTGEKQIAKTDANKRVIFDAALFTNGYSNGDVLEIENVGASKGGSTITISTTTGTLQQVTLTCTATSTSAVYL